MSVNNVKVVSNWSGLKENTDKVTYRVLYCGINVFFYYIFLMYNKI